MKKGVSKRILSKEDVFKIYEQKGHGWIKSIAKELGVSEPCVKDVRYGKNYKEWFSEFKELESPSKKSDGYPDAEELDTISKWPSDDFIGLINFIRDLWTYKNCLKTEWVKDRGWKLRFELITGGWSGNESIIEAMMLNFVFKHIWYSEWKRGGFHVWLIDPRNCGYRLVSDYCKENNFTRQYINQIQKRFKFVKVSQNIRFIKPIK